MLKSQPRAITEPAPIPAAAQPSNGESRPPATNPTIISLPRSAGSSSGPTDNPPSVSPISLFIDLEIEARQCGDLNALRYAIVNSTGRLAQFDLAFLVERSPAGEWAVTLASSVSAIDRQAPLVAAVTRWVKHPKQAQALIRAETRQVDLDAELRHCGIDNETVPFSNGIWLPIKTRDGTAVAALLALKEEKWRPQQTALMIPLVDTYGHAWAALLPQSGSTFTRLRQTLANRRVAWGVTAIILMSMLIPVPLSVLAPAEVVAREHVIVTAPIDGVIGEIVAPPGAWVEKGAPIARFVDVKMRNDAEVASRSRLVAEARYFRIVQSAVSTQKDTQDLAVAKAELEVAKAELEYAEELLKRTEIRAERAGLLIYSSKSDWIGKPIAVGEKIMEIGDPAKSEMMVELPISDAIALKSGSKVSLFLDGDPLQTVAGEVTQTSYRPTLTADQQLAFRIYAKFSDGVARRIGLRGVARVSSEPVALGFYLFRRPIAALRQRFGL
jgi:hypothetical protein